MLRQPLSWLGHMKTELVTGSMICKYESNRLRHTNVWSSGDGSVGHGVAMPSAEWLLGERRWMVGDVSVLHSRNVPVAILCCT